MRRSVSMVSKLKLSICNIIRDRWQQHWSKRHISHTHLMICIAIDFCWTLLYLFGLLLTQSIHLFIAVNDTKEHNFQLLLTFINVYDQVTNKHFASLCISKNCSNEWSTIIYHFFICHSAYVWMKYVFITTNMQWSWYVADHYTLALRPVSSHIDCFCLLDFFLFVIYLSYAILNRYRSYTSIHPNITQQTSSV